ncbi:MAG: CBS domain-containing protein [Candidatus Heimdallarchaeota archaeon]|nr:CBS domain-containing protein [Candidatus Heimdallarchaeota archaeon]
MTSSFSTTVKDYMQNKIIMVDVNDKLITAAQKMSDNNIGALIVMKNDNAIGMLTERDIVKAFVKQAEMEPVSNYMSSPLITIEDKSVLGRATQLMIIKKIRRLPVTNEDGTIVGFFNLRDLMSAIHNSFSVLFDA